MVAWVFCSDLQPEFRSGLKPRYCLGPRLAFGSYSLHDFRPNSKSDFVLSPRLVPAPTLPYPAACARWGLFFPLESMPSLEARTSRKEEGSFIASLGPMAPSKSLGWKRPMPFLGCWFCLSVLGSSSFSLTSVLAAVLLHLFPFYSFLGIWG